MTEKLDLIQQSKDFAFTSLVLPQAEVFKPLWGKKSLVSLVQEIDEMGGISAFVVKKNYKPETVDLARQHLYTQANHAVFLSEEKNKDELIPVAEDCLRLSLAEPENSDDPKAEHYPFLWQTRDFRVVMSTHYHWIADQASTNLTRLLDLMSTENSVLVFEDILKLTKQRDIKQREVEGRKVPEGHILDLISIRELVRNISFSLRDVKLDERGSAIHQQLARTVLLAAKRLPTEVREFDRPLEEGAPDEKPTKAIFLSERDTLLSKFLDEVESLSIKYPEKSTLIAESVIGEFRKKTPETLDKLLIKFFKFTPEYLAANIDYIQKYIDSDDYGLQTGAIELLFSGHVLIALSKNKPKQVDKLKNLYLELLEHENEDVRIQSIDHLHIWYVVDNEFATERVNNLLEKSLTNAEFDRLLDRIVSICYFLDKDFMKGESKSMNAQLQKVLKSLKGRLLGTLKNDGQAEDMKKLLQLVD